MNGPEEYNRPNQKYNKKKGGRGKHFQIGLQQDKAKLSKKKEKKQSNSSQKLSKKCKSWQKYKIRIRAYST